MEEAERRLHEVRWHAMAVHFTEDLALVQPADPLCWLHTRLSNGYEAYERPQMPENLDEVDQAMASAPAYLAKHRLGDIFAELAKSYLEPMLLPGGAEEGTAEVSQGAALSSHQFLRQCTP